mmetsp:Transcript_2402/g.6452  ORF Transcript_2402/g.6452 Transcript_2402/m.6452 type:complete len:279 (-) Transcript_2402:749-1585(-)
MDPAGTASVPAAAAAATAGAIPAPHHDGPIERPRRLRGPVPRPGGQGDDLPGGDPRPRAGRRQGRPGRPQAVGRFGRTRPAEHGADAGGAVGGRRGRRSRGARGERDGRASPVAGQGDGRDLDPPGVRLGLEGERRRRRRRRLGGEGRLQAGLQGRGLRGHVADGRRQIRRRRGRERPGRDDRVLLQRDHGLLDVPRRRPSRLVRKGGETHGSRGGHDRPGLQRPGDVPARLPDRPQTAPPERHLQDPTGRQQHDGLHPLRGRMRRRRQRKGSGDRGQ